MYSFQHKLSHCNDSELNLALTKKQKHFSSSSPTYPQSSTQSRLRRPSYTGTDLGNLSWWCSGNDADLRLHLVACSKMSHIALNDQEQLQLLTCPSGEHLPLPFPDCKINYGLDIGLWLEKCFSQLLALSLGFVLLLFQLVENILPQNERQS